MDKNPIRCLKTKQKQQNSNFVKYIKYFIFCDSSYYFLNRGKKYIYMHFFEIFFVLKVLTVSPLSFHLTILTFSISHTYTFLCIKRLIQTENPLITFPSIFPKEVLKCWKVELCVLYHSWPHKEVVQSSHFFPFLENTSM